MCSLCYAFRHMQMTRLLLIGGVVLVLGAGAMQFLFPPRAVAPRPVVSEPPPQEDTGVPLLDIKEVTVDSLARSAPDLPSIASGDTVALWDFKGAYADNPEQKAKAEAEITRLSDLVGKGAYPDVSLYVGIANQYELLGDGSLEYEYLGRAIQAGNNTSGLPWHNLGVLMERLGALETARAAYEKATLIQPQMKFYHYAYLEFLTTRMKNNAAAIEKEFAAATADLGQESADMRSLYTEWKQS